MKEERIGSFDTFTKQNERCIVINYLRNESGENVDNLYVLYNDPEQGMLVEKLKDTKAYILYELMNNDQCHLVRRSNARKEKGYTKADYIMALHKEYGCDLKTAEEAHNMALEYLCSVSKLKR